MIAIYREFVSGYKFTPQIVKNENVTPEEFAVVSENLQLLQVLILQPIGIDPMLSKIHYDPFLAGSQVLIKVSLQRKSIIIYQEIIVVMIELEQAILKSNTKMFLHGQKSKVKNITDSPVNRKLPKSLQKDKEERILF